MVTNKCQCNWAAASMRQKSILKASYRFHTRGCPQARPPASEGRGAAAGPGLGRQGLRPSWCREPATRMLTRGTRLGRACTCREARLPAWPCPLGHGGKAGGRHPTPSPKSGSRPAGIGTRPRVFWGEMMHPDGWRRGADSGLVVAADVISEKELRKLFCFSDCVSEIVFFFFFLNLILSQSGCSKPQTSNPGLLEGPCPGRCWRRVQGAGGEARGHGVQPATELGPAGGAPQGDPPLLLGCWGAWGGDGWGGQREGPARRHLWRGTCLPEGSYRYPRMPQSAFQNPLFRVCGGGSPLADMLGTLGGLCLGWHSLPRTSRGAGGGRRRESPRLRAMGAGGVTGGLLPAREPPGTLFLSSRRPCGKGRRLPFQHVSVAFKSQNGDAAVWWTGGVWLATNC